MIYIVCIIIGSFLFCVIVLMLLISFDNNVMAFLKIVLFIYAQ